MVTEYRGFWLVEDDNNSSIPYPDSMWPDYKTQEEAEARCASHVARFPDDLVWIEPVEKDYLAFCPDCVWTMRAESEEDAQAFLGVHQIVKLNESLKEDSPD